MDDEFGPELENVATSVLSELGCSTSASYPEHAHFDREQALITQLTLLFGWLFWTKPEFRHLSTD